MSVKILVKSIAQDNTSYKLLTARDFFISGTIFLSFDVSLFLHCVFHEIHSIIQL